MVFDISSFLRIYDYSPEFIYFALNCINKIKKYIVIPSTVDIEYWEHCKNKFHAMKKKIKEAPSNINQQINAAKHKVNNLLEVLEMKGYEGIDELQLLLMEKFDESLELLLDFFQERKVLETITKQTIEEDLLNDIIDVIKKNNGLMSPLSAEEIYQICEEGEKRYKQEIPPGYCDKNNKDGIRKYSDLLIWKEIIKYSKENKANIILITDDVKNNWWEIISETKTFHSKLIEEFKKETNHNIYGFSSLNFYKMISEEYGIEKTSAVEIALNITDNDYYRRVNEKVFDSISFDLMYSGEDFLNVYESHIGSEGVRELEINQFQFITADRIQYNEKYTTYLFEYTVEIETKSHDYYGRDDETDEVYLSPPILHEFEGIIEVEVKREANMFLDYEQDIDFLEALIKNANLKETYFERTYEEDIEDAFDICPDCTIKMNIENDGGNGFCKNCAFKH